MTATTEERRILTDAASFNMAKSPSASYPGKIKPPEVSGRQAKRCAQALSARPDAQRWRWLARSSAKRWWPGFSLSSACSTGLTAAPTS
jgi:hypothetical protein